MSMRWWLGFVVLSFMEPWRSSFRNSFGSWNFKYVQDGWMRIINPIGWYWFWGFNFAKKGKNVLLMGNYFLKLVFWIICPRLFQLVFHFLIMLCSFLSSRSAYAYFHMLQNHISLPTFELINFFHVLKHCVGVVSNCFQIGRSVF